MREFSTFSPMICELEVINVRILSKYYHRINYEVTYDFKGFEISGIYQRFEVGFNTKLEAYCVN